VPDARSPEQDRGAISRRSLLLTAASVAVLGGGAATAIELLTREPGPLTVDEMLRQHPFRVAHRGGSSDWPEMSAYAYRQSVARGYRALEFSAARSSDGVWFGLHDGTLDRTSGTTDFVAAEHTWAEIQKLRISAKATTAPRQPSRPYLRLSDFLAEFGSSHVLFLDPKAADAPSRQEMLDEIRRAIPHPTRQVIAKSYGESVPWAQEAANAGFRTWGYYYAADVTSGLLARTGDAWTMLGMDVGAPDWAWSAVEALRKPIIAHVLRTAQDDRTARARQVAGEVVAGVEAISV
jgi:glycerophosphoryl diester phosphodiesterase